MVTSSQHISQQFEKELQDIRSLVLAMGGLIEQQVANDIASFDALLDGENHTVPYLAGQTLLESMLAHDLKPAYFCQKARCGMCTVIKTAGDVVMRSSEILSDNDKEKGKILLCQSLPLGNDIAVNCDAD